MNKINDYLATFLLPNVFSSNSSNQVDRINQGQPFQEMLLEQMNPSTSFDQTSDSPLSSLLLPSAMQLMPNFLQTSGMQSIAQPSSFHQMTEAYGNHTESRHIMPAENSTKLTKTPPTNKYNGLIAQAADKYGVDANLIHAIIKMESNYNPNVTSHAGAAGLMQLMPITAKAVGVTDRYDIAQNIDGGTRYFSNMLKEQKGDVRMALAAYNAGPGNVKKYGGIPPFKETQNYVRKVLDYYQV